MTRWLGLPSHSSRWQLACRSHSHDSGNEGKRKNGLELVEWNRSTKRTVPFHTSIFHFFFLLFHFLVVFVHFGGTCCTVLDCWHTRNEDDNGRFSKHQQLFDVSPPMKLQDLGVLVYIYKSDCEWHGSHACSRSVPLTCPVDDNETPWQSLALHQVACQWTWASAPPHTQKEALYRNSHVTKLYCQCPCILPYRCWSLAANTRLANAPWNIQLSKLEFEEVCRLHRFGQACPCQVLEGNGQ